MAIEDEGAGIPLPDDEGGGRVISEGLHGKQLGKTARVGLRRWMEGGWLL